MIVITTILVITIVMTRMITVAASFIIRLIVKRISKIIVQK
jgi:hypothetical protein